VKIRFLPKNESGRKLRHNDDIGFAQGQNSANGEGINLLSDVTLVQICSQGEDCFPLHGQNLQRLHSVLK
jgi:hypothetical protein